MREVQVPKLGVSTAEVDIGNWHVKIGDEVTVGTPLVDVESEKSTVTLEAEVAGTITEILAQPGDVVDVGAVICRIRAA